MMQLDPRLDMFNAQKVKSKKEKKWCIQLLYMKLMLLIQEVKDFWLCLPETQEKLNKKLEIKLTQKLLPGEKKVKPTSYQVFSSLMKSICWILSVSPF